MSSKHMMTFGQLTALLKALGFEKQPDAEEYYHRSSDTLILLNAQNATEAVTAVDFVAVRKQLIERGLVSALQFDEANRRSPHGLAKLLKESP